eukprot:8559409-Pyramimonas_sp.AAC.1
MAPISIQAGYVCVSKDGSPPSPSSSWVANTIEIGGRTFAYCDRSDAKFAKFCNRDFSMMDALIDARNKIVLQKMAAVGRDEFAEADAEPVLKRPRRELVDDIDPILD